MLWHNQKPRTDWDLNTIGRTSFHWKDSNRDELETSSSDDKRELVVRLFYPAEADPAGSAAVYLPDADVMQGIWNESQLARIKAMCTHSHENAPIRVAICWNVGFSGMWVRYSDCFAIEVCREILIRLV